MTSLKKISIAIGLAASLGGLSLAEPALAFPATGASTAVTEAQTGTGLPVEHVQYYGYGYGAPCVFPFRCGYGYRGYYGRGFYGRGYGYGYGRGYGRGGYGRGGYRR